jgi:N-acetylmuramoyl-L-alanine amidase
MSKRYLAAALPIVLGAALSAPGASASPSQPSAPIHEHVTEVTAPGQAAPLSKLEDVATGIPSELVGFNWDGTVAGQIQLRSLSTSGWSDWTSFDGEPGDGPDANSKEFRATTAAGPVLVGHGTQRIQFRVTKGRLPHLRLHAIRSENTAALVSPSNATAATGQPAIISRAQWRADESWRTFAPGCDGSVSYADNVHYLIVHHTVDSNSYGPGDSAALVRGIYYFHTHTRLWCDIGYNFLIDQYGQTFEGRFGGMTRPVIGAQAGGFNTGSAGISLIGTFDTVTPPPAMYSALRSLAAWKASIHGVNPLGTVTVNVGSWPFTNWPEGTDVTLPTVVGHRNVDQTDCPGAAAEALLPRLRSDVSADVGSSWVRSFSGWTSQPPAPAVGIDGAPAVTTWGINRFDEFARGKDRGLYHRWTNDGRGTFSPWEALGGRLASSPAAVSWGFNRIDVFVRGVDNALWHVVWAGSGWGWQNLGGVMSSAPAATSWSSGRLDVFTVAQDSTIWHRAWDGSAWEQWEPRGGIGVFDPAATSWGPGRIDLFTVGNDHALWHQVFDGSHWSSWSNDVASTWSAGPAAASWGPGRVDVFLASTAPGRSMVHAWYDTAAGDWQTEPLGGILTAGPAATSWRYNRLDTFVLGNDGNIWHNQDPGV